jgi:hypothetical protein
MSAAAFDANAPHGIPNPGRICYGRWASRWWWRAHPTDFIVTEDAMTIAIILSVAGLGFLCWLAFNLAVQALPFFAGVTAGLFAYHTGAGPFGTITIGLIAGAATLVIGQLIFAVIGAKRRAISCGVGFTSDSICASRLAYGRITPHLRWAWPRRAEVVAGASA